MVVLDHIPEEGGGAKVVGIGVQELPVPFDVETGGAIEADSASSLQLAHKALNVLPLPRAHFHPEALHTHKICHLEKIAHLE